MPIRELRHLWRLGINMSLFDYMFEEVEARVASSSKSVFDSPEVKKVLHTGSRVICSPPPEDTDDDWMLLVHDFAHMDNHLLMNNWVPSLDPFEYDGMEEGLFRSFRKGEVNILITDDEEYFESFKLATQVARDLNLMNKVDRKMLFYAFKHREYTGVLV